MLEEIILLKIVNFNFLGAEITVRPCQTVASQAQSFVQKSFPFQLPVDCFCSQLYPARFKQLAESVHLNLSFK